MTSPPLARPCVIITDFKANVRFKRDDSPTRYQDARALAVQASRGCSAVCGSFWLCLAVSGSFGLFWPFLAPFCYLWFASQKRQDGPSELLRHFFDAF